MSHDPHYVDVTIRGEGLNDNFALACLRAGEEARISGWIRSSDDQIETHIHVEGLKAQIDTFMKWLRGGVPGARIARVDVAPSAPENWEDFQYLG